MPLTPLATRSWTPLICFSLSSLEETVATSKPSSPARADALEHANIKRIVVLRQRYSDRDLVLGADRSGSQQQRCRKQRRSDQRQCAEFQHRKISLAVSRSVARA